MQRFELKAGFKRASVPVVDGSPIVLTEGEPYDTDDLREQLALSAASSVKRGTFTDAEKAAQKKAEEKAAAAEAKAAADAEAKASAGAAQTNDNSDGEADTSDTNKEAK